MTRYTDDELNRELGNLRKPFEPSPARKRAMRQAVFTAKQPRPARHILHWQPLLVSFILLIGIISATTVLIGKPGASVTGWFAKDVTDSWDNTIMEQTSRNEVISYYIVFQENNLHIENTNIGETFMGNVNITQAEVEKMAEDHQAKLAKMTMQPGDYPDYTVKKKNDLYTIRVPGENGFSYTLEKTAPRQYTGEDGIRYSVNKYIGEEGMDEEDFRPSVLKFWWAVGIASVLQAVLTLIYPSKKREIMLSYTFVALVILHIFLFTQGKYLSEELQGSAWLIGGVTVLTYVMFAYHLYKWRQSKKSE